MISRLVCCPLVIASSWQSSSRLNWSETDWSFFIILPQNICDRTVSLASKWVRTRAGCDERDIDTSECVEFAGYAASDQSVVRCDHGDAGDVHGIAGHGDCERLAAAHCGRTGSERGRKHLGADELSGFERGSAAAFGVVEPDVWTQAVLHDLRGGVHCEFAAVRIRA